MKSKIIAATVACLAMGALAIGNVSLAETAGQKIDDATLVTKVKSKLLAAKDVSGLAINVDATNGVVTLSGTADTQAERTKAGKIARDTGGVAKVENKIMVKPAGSSSTSESSK
ncbi:MAG TPA: BON domain-containing protein [Steroidobacteraceae bacterium]|nr:BON domain-containing protein [Steroidobacteraceae bacterium]